MLCRVEESEAGEKKAQTKVTDTGAGPQQHSQSSSDAYFSNIPGGVFQ